MKNLRAIIFTACLMAGQLAAAQNVLPLAGVWRFRLDADKVGLRQRWFESHLPGQIRLPGSTDEAKLGLPNPAKPSLDGLYRPNIYAGAAWYQRDVEVPDAWRGKRILLLAERVHWETRTWFDGRELAVQDSLISPHVHDLGTAVVPGRHTLTICVNNSLKFDLGGFVSILYEGTQTNWNGLIGRLELRERTPYRSTTCKSIPTWIAGWPESRSPWPTSPADRFRARSR